jgi:hypothetical protein
MKPISTITLTASTDAAKEELDPKLCILGTRTKSAGPRTATRTVAYKIDCAPISDKSALEVSDWAATARTSEPEATRPSGKLFQAAKNWENREFQ